MGNISDDIIIWGKTQAEHDQALHKCLTILRNHGLTANSEKCEFSMPEITYFGMKVSAEGVSPTPQKCEAVQHFQTPRNAQEVRSFLGLLNFLHRFIPNLAHISEPLRNLTKSDTKWTWTEREEGSFQELKSQVTSNAMFAHFNSTWASKVVVDAIPVGLGALLMQQSPRGDRKVVAYA